MSEFQTSTHRTCWLFAKDQLAKQRDKKQKVLAAAVARAIARKQVELKPTANPKGTVSFFVKKYLKDPEALHKIAGKEFLTPPQENVYLNHCISWMLRCWPDLPTEVKVMVTGRITDGIEHSDSAV